MSASGSASGKPTETWDLLRHLVLVMALVGAAWFQGSHLEDKSPTEDEWAHLVRGIHYWNSDDMRLQYAHPPLSNMITALPVAFDDDIPDFTELNGWDIARVGTVAYAYISDDYEEARSKLMRARRALLLIHAIGILYIYFWGWRTFGWAAGAAGAVMFALHPTILGQARYVTTDLAAGVTAMIAVGEFARHLQGRGKLTTWGTLPAAVAAAILAKHSGLLLAPIFVVITFAAAWRGRSIYRGQEKRARLKAWLGHTAFTAAVVVFAINAAYKFDDTFLTVQQVIEQPEPQYWVSEGYNQYMLEWRSPMGVLPEYLPLPLPYTWMFGVTAVAVQSKVGFAWSSFFGYRTPGGHFLYFPLMLLVKSPATVLGLVGFAGYTYRKKGRLPRELLVVALVLAGFLFFSMRSRINMGVRHAMPMVALLVMWAAAGFQCALDRWTSTDSRRRLIAATLGLLTLSAIYYRSDYLGYFNVGPDLGHRISVVGDDWGQDRAGFAKAVEQHGFAPLYYDSQTETRALEARHLEMKYFELECETEIPDGVFVAVHATRRLKIGEECMVDLIDREPIWNYNHHVLVYWIPPAPKVEEPEPEKKSEAPKTAKKRKKRRKKGRKGRRPRPAAKPEQDTAAEAGGRPPSSRPAE